MRNGRKRQEKLGVNMMGGWEEEEIKRETNRQLVAKNTYRRHINPHSAHYIHLRMFSVLMCV